jgi:hypothetical protein
MAFPGATDPALALNVRAKAEGWPIRCDSALCFERPELNALRDIWLSLAARERTPSRSKLDARTLKPFLRNIMIVERVYVDAATWRYRMRFEGSSIVEVAGESTGRFMDECHPPELLPLAAAPYDAVLDQGAPMRLVADLRTRRLDHLTAECLIAPLADARGETTLALRGAYFRPKAAIGKAHSDRGGDASDRCSTPSTSC